MRMKSLQPKRQLKGHDGIGWISPYWPKNFSQNHHGPSKFISLIHCFPSFYFTKVGLPTFPLYTIIFLHSHVVRRKGSGFGSKMNYSSGFFHLRIKLLDRDSAGVVTAYYLTSQGNTHDELDFEFLGNREGKPYTLQTNVFANGQGNREQRLHLWFDPAVDFHNYKILWNKRQIVFYVDNIPIRVYKNKSNIGVGYPSKPMQIQATLWDGDSWATDGGQTKTNWSYAPFKANFQGFDVSGCSQVDAQNSTQHCSSDDYWWNTQKFGQLDPARQRQYAYVKHNYMTYDYCSDKPRYPTPPLECAYN